MRLREAVVLEREKSAEAAELEIDRRLAALKKQHSAEMRGHEERVVQTLYKKGYVQLEYGGGAIGTVGMRSVEWGGREKIEKTMAEREANVKKRERDVEDLDQKRAEWEKAEKKKRLTLERVVMDRLQKGGCYISESGKKTVVSQAGMAQEIMARDAVMETQAVEAETLREKGRKADQEKLEYKKKLKEEKEKVASLL